MELLADGLKAASVIAGAFVGAVLGVGLVYGWMHVLGKLGKLDEPGEVDIGPWGCALSIAWALLMPLFIVIMLGLAVRLGND